MNREILFRGQVCGSKNWVEGSLLFSDKKPHILVNLGQTISKRNGMGFWNIEKPCYQIIAETIGQFTGLTDKNGVKIFEGDIIQDKYDESCKHVIKYFEEECCFGVLYIGLNGSLTPSSRLTKDWINEFDKVVIGNIHDNSELLKQENL